MSSPLNMLWRKSSSLIVLGRNQNLLRENGFDYKVLVLERPSRLTFPGAFVFPGGVTEEADESVEWLRLFKSMGIDEGKLNSIAASGAAGQLKNEIASRITAVRETFEELGILLCKNRNGFAKNTLLSENLDGIDIKAWQQKIHNNASRFLELCMSLDVAPDLWGLHQWASWLTPTSFKRRFHTDFYLVALDNQAVISADQKEVVSAKWETPSKLLKLNYSEKIWLPPPQIYELSRLCKLLNLNELIEFSANRIRNGYSTTLTFPINYNMKDGFVHCYPGDDFYPKNPDFNQTSHNDEEFDKHSCAEFRSMAKNLHRSEHYSLHNVQIVQNIRPSDNHIDASTQLNNKFESKL